LIAFAEQALGKAWKLKQPGRYQLEAAIQSAHATSRLSGRDVSEDILTLYESLLRVAPSIGAEIGYAAALANAGKNDDALTRLDAMDQSMIQLHQPYWAVRAHTLKALGREALANMAFDRAIGLSGDDAARQFLARRKAARD
jgi:RNA polymerase sigma-70 factor (ECF subfamily)